MIHHPQVNHGPMQTSLQHGYTRSYGPEVSTQNGERIEATPEVGQPVEPI